MSGVLTCILLGALTPEPSSSSAFDPGELYWRFAHDLPESDADKARREADQNKGILVMLITGGICGVILYYDLGGRCRRWIWSKLKGRGESPFSKIRAGGHHHGAH